MQLTCNSIKKLISALSLLLAGFTVNAQNVKESELFNEDWKFHKGDVTGAEAAKFDDSEWRKLALPHDWSIEEPFSNKWASATGYLPGGIGWYRKSFSITTAQKNRRFYIYFDGVYMNSEVWVNGHYLGKRPNGFTPFEYDITRYVHSGAANIIAVKVDHTQFADARWYTGSGIYRNVYLKVKDPVHLKLWGVAFSTPAVGKNKADARVDLTISNNRSGTSIVTVNTKLTTFDGKLAVQKTTKLGIPAGGTGSASLNMPVINPQLWSTAEPKLYKLSVTVLQNGRVADTWQDEVGIRKIHFDTNKGFFLNDESVKLKGVCIHDDAGALGVAVPPEVWVRRLRKLKASGCNAIRMSHNPHAEYLYSLCDKMGFLVMDEAFDEWEYGKNKWVEGWNVGTPANFGYHQYFKEWGERDVKDMVLRSRNHPSIIMWSIGNEVDYPNDPYTHPVLDSGRNPQIYGKGYMPDHPPVSRLGDISKKLVAAVKSADKSRPVTAALAGVVQSNTTDYPGNLDVVGYNYQEYRYKDDHAKYPDRIIYGSENGMGVSAWNAVDSNEFISAQFLWTGVDYMGEAGKWPSRSNMAGLLDLAGFEKAGYYLRAALWKNEPLIYAGAFLATTGERQQRGMRAWKRDWNFADTAKVVIRCFTNCDEAELFVNGKSFGRKIADKSTRSVAFDAVNFIAGKVTIKGFLNGKEVCTDELVTVGTPSALKINRYMDKLITNSSPYQQLEVHITDEQGNVVQNADGLVKVNATGAVMMGIENGDAESHEAYQDAEHHVKNGRLIIFLKKTGINKAKVILSYLSLPEAKIEF